VVAGGWHLGHLLAPSATSTHGLLLNPPAAYGQHLLGRRGAPLLLQKMSDFASPGSNSKANWVGI
jgi:hypothetical protein